MQEDVQEFVQEYGQEHAQAEQEDLAASYRDLLKDAKQTFDVCVSDGMQVAATKLAFLQALFVLINWLCNPQDNAARRARVGKSNLIVFLVFVIHQCFLRRNWDTLSKVFAAVIHILVADSKQASRELLEMTMRAMYGFQSQHPVQYYGVLIIYYSTKNNEDLKNAALSMFVLHRLRDIMINHFSNAKLIRHTLCCLTIFFQETSAKAILMGMQINLENYVRSVDRCYPQNADIQTICNALKRSFEHARSLMPYKFD